MIFLFQRIKKAISISRSMIFLFQDITKALSISWSTIFLFQGTKKALSISRSMIFLFQNITEAISISWSMIFLFQNITKAISISWSMTFSKKLPRVKNFRVPIFRVLGPNFSCFRSQNCHFWSQSAGQKILSKVIFTLNLGIHP